MLNQVSAQRSGLERYMLAREKIYSNIFRDSTYSKRMLLYSSVLPVFTSYSTLEPWRNSRLV